MEIVEDPAFWEDFDRADIYITPPSDDENISGEDSGDEDAEVNIDKLSGPQLRAQATATVHGPNGKEHLSDSESEEDNIPLSELRRKFQGRKIRNWAKSVEIIPPNIDFPNLGKQILCSDPVEYFELFFCDEVCTFLRRMFVNYARSKSDFSFDLSVEELKCFLAILLLSGYIDVPRWRMLWECDTEAYNPFVANAMRRNRFELIKRYAHCADNTNLPKNDKFAKLRPLFELLNKRYLEYASFQQHLSIDESMVPYFGRHSAKQFIRGKPIRYGYKMWCLCEPLGYLMQFEPYQGKQDGRKNMDLGVGGSTVMFLTSKLPNNVYFKIYADRYFSSLKLVNALQEIGYGYTGTIMANRIEKCPITPGKVLERKERGTYEFCTDTESKVTITTWNDNRAVVTVSSCDTVTPIQNVSRWISKEKKKLPVPQPLVISKYNKYMGGVDRMDENIDRYRVSIRSKKWWWANFAFAIDTSVHNAWQVYRRNAENGGMDYLAFRRYIVQVYLKKYATPVVGGGRPKSSQEICSRVLDNIRYDRCDHWIVVAEKQNRCALCKKNATKKCEKCNVNLHDFCFKSFHVK